MTSTGVAGGRGSRRKATSNVIKVLQVNAQHAKQAKHEINRWIDKQGSEYLVLVQEPYLYRGKPAIQPISARKYYNNIDGVRTAIYARKGIKAWYIDHLSGKDATVLVTRINKRATVVASLYMDYNENTPVVSEKIQDIVDYARSKGSALLLGIDSNCHSTLFGNETNKRGEELEDFIAQNRLIVENTGRIPTFQTQWGTSIIDLSLIHI